MRKSKFFGFALVAALFVFHPSWAASLIINGGFEQPTTNSDLFIPAGDPSLVGWTIVSGSIDVVPSTGGSWPAFEGIQSLDLDGRSAGTIEQVFATTVGTTYLLSFEYAKNPGGLPSANVSVLGAGALPLLTQDISHSSSTAADMDWSLFTRDFTADSATTTLRFTSFDAPSSVHGIALDAISVACYPFPGGGNTGGCFPGPGPFPGLPEPPTLALLAVVLAGLGLSGRKRCS